MEGRARHRKPKVSRLLGDEAERIIGRAQWTGGDIVYTSIPRGDKKNVRPPLSLRPLALASSIKKKISEPNGFSKRRLSGEAEGSAGSWAFAAKVHNERLNSPGKPKLFPTWYLRCGEHSVRSLYALVAVSRSLTGFWYLSQRDASMSVREHARFIVRCLMRNSMPGVPATVTSAESLCARNTRHKRNLSKSTYALLARFRPATLCLPV